VDGSRGRSRVCRYPGSEWLGRRPSASSPGKAGRGCGLSESLPPLQQRDGPGSANATAGIICCCAPGTFAISRCGCAPNAKTPERVRASKGRNGSRGGERFDAAAPGVARWLRHDRIFWKLSFPVSALSVILPIMTADGAGRGILDHLMWVRFEDDFANHPKVAPLADGAFRIWVTMIAYSNRYRLNGSITRAQVERECRTTRARPRHVASLTAAGLWHKTNTGFQIHDIGDYQPTAAKSAELSEKRSEAGKKGAAARRGKDSNLPLAKNAPVPTRPDPTRPDPSLDAGSSDFLDSALAVEGAGFNKYGSLLGAGLQAIRNLLPIYRAEIADAMKTNGRSWVYAARVIESARTEKARGKGPAAQGPEPKGRGWEPYVPPEDDDL
jgi:hypothetical protein